MYEITKEFKFSAGHFLYNLPETHQCSRQHGHNYLVEVCLRSDRLNEVGFIVDTETSQISNRLLTVNTIIEI